MADPLQDCSEEFLWNRYLGQLERHIPGVMDYFRSLAEDLYVARPIRKGEKRLLTSVRSGPKPANTQKVPGQ